MAAAVVDPLDEVRVALQGPLGLTPQGANRFINTAGITSMSDIEMLRPDDAGTIIKRHNEAHTSTALRQYQLGITHQKKLEGFLYWYHDKVRRQQPIVAADFTVGVMKHSMAQNRAESLARETEQKDLNPGQIETGSGYFSWSERAESALIAMIGKSGEGPLYRVVRPDQPPGWTAPNPTIQLCYDLPLAGIGFDQDNQQVWQLIQRWVIKDSIYQWIKSFEISEDGRGAWFAIKDQLEGKAAINARANEANRVLGNGQGAATWTNEYGYKFQKYSTNLQGAYTSLYKCHGIDTPAAARVRRMLDGMRPNDKQVLIQIAKSHVADNLMNDWIGACQYLQAKVDEAFPPKETHGRKRGYRQVSQTGSSGRGGRFGRGGGRQRGRGGRGGAGRGGRGGRGRGGTTNVYNGVDISDHSRNFTGQEFTQMGEDGRREVHKRRKGHYDSNNHGTNDQQNNDRAVQHINVQENNGNDNSSVLTDNPGAIVPYSGNNNSQDRNRGGTNGDAIGRRGPP